jgi:putative phosphoribosyl transferase
MLFREEDEDLEVLPFADRAEAGHLLASKLAAYSHRRDVVVLGPPRGGVTVAFGVASALDVALDVLVLSKIGIPWNQELAMGAVAEHGVQVFDLSIAKQLCISETEIQEAAAIARDELQSREKLYRSGRLPVELAGKTVVLVDDGIATGCTILVAIAAVQRQKAARVVVAVPVAPLHGCSSIRMEADEVITAVEPKVLFAVSQFYVDFGQVSDEDVQRRLEDAVGLVPCAA